MKPVSLLFFLSLWIGMLFPLSCKKNPDPQIEFEQYNKITPQSQAHPNYTLADLPDSAPSHTDILHSVPPKIKIPDSTPLVQTINMNIDTDDTDEQMILVKENTDVNARFKLLIVDYLQIFDYYALTSEHLLAATHNQSLQTFLMDVDLDQNAEIVCTGYNQDDGQTMDIFKYDPATLVSGLRYEQVFSLTSSGSLEILQDPETGAFSIERQQEAAPDSDFIVKEHFSWNPMPTPGHPLGSFTQSRFETLKKEKVSNRQLQTIIQSADLHRQEAFLNGTWVLERNIGKTDAVHSFLLFETPKKALTLYTDAPTPKTEAHADLYHYQKYRRLFYNRFQIEGRSQIHDFKTIRIVAAYLTMDSIRVDLYDNDTPVAKSKINTDQSGIYRRVDEKTLQQTVEAKNNRDPLPVLNGIYTQRPGRQYIFDDPFFRVRTGKEAVEKGGYALYRMDVPIMEMHFFDANGSVRSRNCYQFDYEETQTGRKRFKTITLTPGTMTLHGFKKGEGDPIQLQNEEWLFQ